MLLATFEPGQEMAIANFSLALFVLFTITLPFLLITRGDKTKANREFIAATVNPWSQIGNEMELTPVVVSGNSSAVEVQPQPVLIDENRDEQISESERIISLEIKRSEEQEGVSSEISEFNEEILVA